MVAVAAETVDKGRRSLNEGSQGIREEWSMAAQMELQYGGPGMWVPWRAIEIREDILPREQKFPDRETVERYAADFYNLPPITVQRGTFVLIDGRHRLEAAKDASPPSRCGRAPSRAIGPASTRTSPSPPPGRTRAGWWSASSCCAGGSTSGGSGRGRSNACADLVLGDGGGVGAEHAHPAAARAQERERFAGGGRVHVPVDVQVEDVGPRPLTARPRLDLREVHTRGGERLERADERAGPVVGREDKARLRLAASER